MVAIEANTRGNPEEGMTDSVHNPNHQGVNEKLLARVYWTLL
jgi:hypothetical protein